MNWVEIAWPLLSGVCLTLGLVYFLIWWRQRQKPALLVFSFAAFLVSASGLLEMTSMHATSPEGVASALRPIHIEVVFIAASIAAYARLQFRAGIAWLAVASIGLRAAMTLPAMVFGDTLRFGRILQLQRVELWGGVDVSLPLASPNPVGAFIGIADALLVLFFASVIVQVRRRTEDAAERRHVLAVCGSLMVFVSLATGWATLIGLGVVRAPFFMIFFFMSFLLVIAYDLGGSVIRARGLEIRLRDTETHLRGTEERFRIVVESSPTAMLMLDVDERISLVNAQATNLFGYTRDELLGLDMDLLVQHDARNDHAVARRCDGTEVRVDVTLTPVHIGEDRLVLASVTDISERLRIEQEVAVQREALAHLSRISLLGEMSASLAHELNQPLTAVLSNAQAALRFLDHAPPDLDEVRQSLLHIVENDKRAGEVIRRLRAMLRKEQIDYQPLVVNEVVHDVLRLLSSDLLNRDVSMTLELAPDLPLVLGDRVQMQQVLLNLIVNACDAMASVAGDRIVSVRTHLADESHLEIAVADIGPGIPAADLERIFTPFVTTKPQGMGLGLAVCRTILEAHHGTLHATNAADGGATMLVRLPLLASETTTSEAAEREGATVRA